MIKIVNTPHIGIQLRNDAGVDFPIGTLEELTALNREITQYLQKRGKTEYISTFRARRLALAEGNDIPTNSITAACAFGRIPNARKLKGRWQMPVAGWEAWYAEWKLKKSSEIQEESTRD
mgnify:CR=1 FL=1